MVVKARKESSGMFTKPSHSIWTSEQGTPFVQGRMASGMTPATSSTWKTEMPQPASDERERVAHDPRIEGEEPHRQQDHEREHGDALVPAQRAGRQLHHLAEEERPEGGGGSHEPGREDEGPGRHGRTSSTAIIPASSCSRMWQWTMRLPGRSWRTRIVAVVPAGTSTVSSHAA